MSILYLRYARHRKLTAAEQHWPVGHLVFPLEGPHVPVPGEDGTVPPVEPTVHVPYPG